MFPNLWLIGPPKAGTSTLFSLLSQHPSVVSSSPKETFYLLDQEFGLLNSSSNYWREGAEGWTQFFELSTKKAEYILEGTTHLLYQEETLKVIASMGGESKAIAVYRDPADRVMSSFFLQEICSGDYPSLSLLVNMSLIYLREIVLIMFLIEKASIFWNRNCIFQHILII